MFNCHRVFRFGRLFCIVHTLAQAEAIIRAMLADQALGTVSDWQIEPAFIEGAGF
jgi:hypothetical protein